MRAQTWLTAVSAVVGLACPALADAIDGNWCHTDGRRFTIRGPDIVTPGGVALKGDYGRHSFAYNAPAAAQGGGEPIYMTLMGENLVHLRYGEGASANAESWVRCAPSISGLTGLTGS